MSDGSSGLLIQKDSLAMIIIAEKFKHEDSKSKN